MFFITRKHDKDGKVIEETVENFVLDKNDRGGGTLDRVKFEDVDFAEKILGKPLSKLSDDELAGALKICDDLLRVDAQCNYAIGKCLTCGKPTELKSPGKPGMSQEDLRVRYGRSLCTLHGGVTVYVQMRPLPDYPIRKLNQEV
jgi:hypothetical protein